MSASPWRLAEPRLLAPALLAAATVAVAMYLRREESSMPPPKPPRNARDAVGVTCGSAVKLRHQETGYHLHSHQIRWGTGSGQQSVTAHGSADDQGGLWLVKEAHGGLPCEVGQPILCGRTVRLEHVRTGLNLHTHRFSSPVSRQQEVSCFGEGGQGDSGDNWVVLCEGIADGQPWQRGSAVRLRSPDTGAVLRSQEGHRFTSDNCPGSCPILGQQEVHGAAHTARTAGSELWVADQGVYLGATS
ncbi:unnamed protein product [Phaeothamnion confervicola]